MNKKKEVKVNIKFIINNKIQIRTNKILQKIKEVII